MNMLENSTAEINNEVKLKDLMAKASGLLSYLRSKWMVITLVSLLGALSGFVYAILQPVKYTSQLTFVLEESKGGVGGLASLAGQFGFDIGGASGGGIFNGDNILLFLKSKALVRETLLSQYKQDSLTLADKYISSYKLKKKWKKQELLNVNFYNKNDKSLSRTEDSVLQLITEKIIKKELTVARPDKKASFIEVKSTMLDEVLSKLFCDRLVIIALDRYVTSKLKVKQVNVKILQRRADSLEALLNSRTFNAAASQQSLLDINPGLRVATASPEIRTREKMTVGAIYSEVVKNLELAKTILSQETPAIELVDQSSFPLEKVKTSKTISVIGWGLAAMLFILFYLILKRWWKELSNS